MVSNAVEVCCQPQLGERSPTSTCMKQKYRSCRELVLSAAFAVRLTAQALD